MVSDADAISFFSFSPGGTASGYIGVLGSTAGQLVPDAAAGDMVLRTQTASIRFSTNGGSSTVFDINTAGQCIATGYFQTNQATYLMVAGASFTNGAGAAAGTLTNAPAAGNPTKWVAIDDNGTIRHIPAW